MNDGDSQPPPPPPSNSQPQQQDEQRQQQPAANNDVTVEEAGLSIALTAAVMAEGDDDVDEEEEDDDDEGGALIVEAQRLMDKITDSPANPNPTVLHALACILETQELRYVEEVGYMPSNNSRASHNVGRLGTLLRENDEFFELISDKYLSETRYSISVQAAALRLLLSCSSTWTYPHVFEENVMEKIKGWITEENDKCDVGEKTSSDLEMLKTYSTGLLAVALIGDGQVVEDVLSSGLSSNLMRYLRTRVLGDTNTGQKDAAQQADKNVNTTVTKGSKENCGRLWLDDGGSPKGLTRGKSEDKDYANANEQDIHDVREKYVDSDDDKDESLRRKVNTEWARTKGNERVVQRRSNKDKSLLSSLDAKKVPEMMKSLSRINADILIVEREANNECFQDCIVGTKDISNLVKKAVRAAELEAKAANGSEEAIRAAGDAAAEVVKSAALEEFTNSGNDEAAVLAASRAASTVIDAANATDVSGSSTSINADSVSESSKEPNLTEEVEEFFIRDNDTLAKLRDKYSIQCIETLGEYVEVLGPVLHEKGVDVCLALLHRCSKVKEPSKVAVLLPDVLNLISALSAHRKFSALFVDRGGLQKLLSVPRISQTFFGLSSCLNTFGSIQVIMERVCTLPSDVVHHVIELALQLLECSQELARKNVALFFINAFAFRAVLDCFDAQDGSQKLLSLLNDAATVRSGVNSRGIIDPSSGSIRNDRSPADVLTSFEKQIAYHTCHALRQYFRARLLLLVDSIRPNKNNRSAARNLPCLRAPYKPLDIGNDMTMDAVFLQIQRDRKLGPAFVRARWPEVEKFLSSNGHIIMLELCQAPPVERYLHDLLQYALGVLHIVSLGPYSRKLIVNATLSNDRVGIAVILDAAHSTSNVEPEIIQPALNVLVNLVCPPPSISNKPSLQTQGQQSVPSQATNCPNTDTMEKNAERSVPENAVSMTSQSEQRERNVEPSVMGRSGLGTPSFGGSSQTSVLTVGSGLVGDRRIVLGAGAGSAGLAAQLEQGYSQAREAVRSNNGIKVLLQLLQPRVGISPAALDCLRALACRVLLGLARDDAIAHILIKLQVGKKLSELIRDPGIQAHGTEQGRWQAELAQTAIELIAVVTNCGRGSTLAATDAAVPTLRRIERAAIAAATPITYHSRELLLLVHEHLQASGLATTAATLLKEAQLTPLPSLAGASTLLHQVPEEGPAFHIKWPSGRVPGGFLSAMTKCITGEEDSRLECDSAVFSSKKKPLVFSSSLSFRSRKGQQSHDSNKPSHEKGFNSSKKTSALPRILESSTTSLVKSNIETDPQSKTPLAIVTKRKLTDSEDNGFTSLAKRVKVSGLGVRSPIFPTPNTGQKSGLMAESFGFSTPTPNLRDQNRRSTLNVLHPEMDNNQMTPSSFQPVVSNDPLPVGTERLTLDSIVVQYLKHQHRQCPAPITTLPPLSLFHPHVCPEPKRNLDAPSNVTARLGAREFRNMYSGIRGSCRDRQFVYSRFKPWRTCRDDGALLTCIAFLQKSSQIVVGSHSGELKTFDTNSNILLESCTSHQSPVTLVQSNLFEERQLLLSSSYHDVRLWDASSMTGGPTHVFDKCKAARFSTDGTFFAALSTESSQREILLYDTNTCKSGVKLSDPSSSSSGRGHGYSTIHFDPSNNMVLWNGLLWDRRGSGLIHRFDQFTDYGGGGFHPTRNEVIINSEVWDIRKKKLLRSVPSLDQTTITFNGQGDVIYANLRRNLDDITSAVNTRRAKHPLFSAFRTVDAINYSDIATIPVDRCVLDFAMEPTDSFLGLVTMDDQEDMYASARVYEIGRRRPMDDDSDPDDAESEEEEDDDDEEEDDNHPLLGSDLFDDADDLSMDDDSTSGEDDDDEGDGHLLMHEDFGFGGFGMMSDVDGDEDEDDDDSEIIESYSSGDEED